MSRRLDDWPERLEQATQGVSSTPFAWGEHDCALAAGRAVEAVTGIDPVAELRGRYSTKTGAARVLRRLGHEDLVAAADAFCEREGWTRVEPAYAQRGDLVATETDDGPALGWVAAAGRALYVAESGLAAGRARDALAAWRIG